MKRTIAVTILSLALGGRALFGQNLDKRAFCSVSEAVLEGAFPDNAQLTPQGRATLESLSRMKILGIVQASPLAHTYPMGGSDPSLQIYHPARLRFNINQREKPFSVESYGASAASETGTVWICSLTLNTSPISIIWISKEVRQFEGTLTLANEYGIHETNVTHIDEDAALLKLMKQLGAARKHCPK